MVLDCWVFENSESGGPRCFNPTLSFRVKWLLKCLLGQLSDVGTREDDMTVTQDTGWYDGHHFDATSSVNQAAQVHSAVCCFRGCPQASIWQGAIQFSSSSTSHWTLSYLCRALHRTKFSILPLIILICALVLFTSALVQLKLVQVYKLFENLYTLILKY